MATQPTTARRAASTADTYGPRSFKSPGGIERLTPSDTVFKIATKTWRARKEAPLHRIPVLRSFTTGDGIKASDNNARPDRQNEEDIGELRAQHGPWRYNYDGAGVRVVYEDIIGDGAS